MEFALNVYDKNTDSFLYQVDVYESFTEAEERAKSLALEGNEEYHIVAISMDDYGNEIGVFKMV